MRHTTNPAVVFGTHCIVWEETSYHLPQLGMLQEALPRWQILGVERTQESLGTRMGSPGEYFYFLLSSMTSACHCGMEYFDVLCQRMAEGSVVG